MTVEYKPIDGEEVSALWYPLLWDIRHIDGVAFNVNEGHRTMARQRELFNQNMQFVGGRWVPKPGHPLTAFPSDSAPHIRTGRPDHAIDFNNAEGVRVAAAKRGVKLVRTVRWPDGSVREEWHLEAADVEQLREYNGHRRTRIAALKAAAVKAKKRWKRAAAAYHRRIGR